MSHTNLRDQLANKCSKKIAEMERQHTREAFDSGARSALLYGARVLKESGAPAEAGILIDLYERIDVATAAETMPVGMSCGQAPTPVCDLVPWIRRRGGSVTAHELHHGRRGSFPTSKAAKASLQALVNHGVGEWRGRRFYMDACFQK